VPAKKTVVYKPFEFNPFFNRKTSFFEFLFFKPCQTRMNGEGVPFSVSGSDPFERAGRSVSGLLEHLQEIHWIPGISLLPGGCRHVMGDDPAAVHPMNGRVSPLCGDAGHLVQRDFPVVPGPDSQLVDTGLGSALRL
jgi:hypothetical protein